MNDESATNAISEEEGSALARRFARVIARMHATHPTAAGIVTAAGINWPGLDEYWLADIVPRLEREWPETEGGA
jgi:hypothetical protein